MYLSNTALIIISQICLLSGTSIYLLFRPQSLLIFYWLDIVGLKKFILRLRDILPLDSIRNDFIIYSMPFALWLLSYILIMEVLWEIEPNSKWKYFWIYNVVVISISTEFLQIFPQIPGRFDIYDFLALLGACLIGIILTQKKDIKYEFKS